MRKWTLVLLMMPIAAHADLIQIQAEGVGSLNFDATDFTIVFDDVSADGLFQFSELVSFSGTTFSVPNFPVIFQLGSGLLGVGNIAGVSTASGLTCGDWCFSNGGGNIFGIPIGDPFSAPQQFWTYSVSVIAVPEPGTFALLGIGLFGVGLARRRKPA